MGNDGAEGAKILSAVNAKIIVQDPQSSVVWGMPGSVFKSDLAYQVLPPDKIGKLISKAAHK